MMDQLAPTTRRDGGLVDPVVSDQVAIEQSSKAASFRSTPPLISRRSSGRNNTMAMSQIVPLFKSDVICLWKTAQTCDKRKLCRTCLKRQYWKWYIIAFIVIAISTVVSMKHRLIVTKVEPFASQMRHWPGGWLIPVTLLVIVSFPPLIGHEIIGLICGLIYGLGWGFFILAGGTFLGELATWFAFKSCCTARAAKFEKKNIYYASLTQLIREKSFAFVLILRFSAIPGHIVTAISSSAGAHFLSYCAAAFLTLPKQLALVYMGTAFRSANHTTHLVSVIMLLLTLLGTGIAAVYVYYQMRLYLILNGHSTWPDQDSAMALPMTAARIPGQSYTPSIVSKTDPDATCMGPLVFIDDVSYEKLQSGRGYARRPFLHSNSSFIVTPRTLSRANSLPTSGAIDIQDQLSKRLESLFDTSKNTATSSAADLLGASLRPSADAESTHRSMMVHDDIAALHDVHYERGTASMDLWRPESMTLGQQGKPPRPHVVSGREIAADADAYARLHGRREYGRTRGDSSAALLGRPPSLDDEPTDDSDIQLGEVR